jgi:hypothetical protein
VNAREALIDTMARALHTSVGFAVIDSFEENREEWRWEAADALDAALAYRDEQGRQLIWGQRAVDADGDPVVLGELFVACDIEEQ